MMKKKKRVDAPNHGQPEKKRKLNEMLGNKEDEEMINLSKVVAKQEANKATEAEESQEEVVFECLNCSG
jgi:hypothetical protein